MRRFMGLGLLLLLAGAGARGGDGRKEEIRGLFAQGVDLFEQGKLADAKRMFRRVLAMRPTEQEAASLVDLAGTKLFFRMMANVEMGTEPTIIWELRRRFMRRERDPEFIRGVVDKAIDPANPDEVRWQAIQKMAEIGQFCVPFLVRHLGNELDPDARANAKVALVRLGRRGVLPTIELLAHPSRLVRENAAMALGDIEPSDARAVAGLKEVTEQAGETETVKNLATVALENITGQKYPQLSSAAEYYYRKAERYYLETAGVPSETEEADGVIWHLNPDGELVYLQVPYYAWNELMAEEACHDCFRADPSFDVSIPLYASMMAAQYAEVRELADLAQEQPGGRPLSEEEIQEVRERQEKMKAALFLVASVGPEYLYKALRKALDDNRADVAVVLIDTLKDTDPRGGLLPKFVAVEPGARGKPAEPSVSKAVGESLLAALSYQGKGAGTEGFAGGKDVRYHAAIALAWMNPPQRFPGCDLVVKTLASAVGETGPGQILLIEENQSVRNVMRARFEGLGYGVTMAAEGRDGLAQATAFPPKDMIVVADNLKANWDTKRMLEELKADPRSHYVPMLILTDIGRRDEARRQFPDHRVMHREDDPETLKLVTEEVLAGRTTIVVHKQRAEAIAVAAADALNKIDPYNTVLTPADATTALIAALRGRADVVRLPCIMALGRFKLQLAFEPLLEVFRDKDKTNAIEIRRGALWALGRVNPAKAFRIFLDAELNEGDFELRRLAAEGHGLGVPDYQTAIRFLNAVRIEKEKKER